MAMVAWLTACNAAPKRPVALDRDNDSVADDIDACPGTVVGTPVTADGCSVFASSLAAVEFAPSDYRLNSESRAALTDLVELLNIHNDVTVQLGGHTDNRGSASDNLALSKQRVMAVVKFLVANGIPAERLKPFGFGENRPLMSNATAAGRAQNRRIELTVVRR